MWRRLKGVSKVKSSLKIGASLIANSFNNSFLGGFNFYRFKLGKVQKIAIKLLRKTFLR